MSAQAQQVQKKNAPASAENELVQASQEFAPQDVVQGAATPLMRVAQEATPVQMQPMSPSIQLAQATQFQEKESAEDIQMEPAVQLSFDMPGAQQAPLKMDEGVSPRFGTQMSTETRQLSPMNPAAINTGQISPIQQTAEEEVEQEQKDGAILRKETDPGDSNIKMSPESATAPMNGGASSTGNLPGPIQAKASSVLGHDFSGVNISEDDSAPKMKARAYAQGESITFAPGQYDPGSKAGQQLIGHELTHVAQQREGRVQPTVQKKGIWINDDRQLEQEADQKGWQIANSPSTEVANSAQLSGPTTKSNNATVAQGNIIEDILDYIDLGPVIDSIPGYSLFSYLLGYDFLRGSSVEPTAHNLVKGFLGLIGPLGLLLYNKLSQYGALDAAFEWMDKQLDSLNISWSKLIGVAEDAWDDMDFVRTDIVSYNLGVLGRHFGYLLDDIEDFVGGLVDSVIDFLTDALVNPLVGYLEENSAAYRLATKVLGSRFPLEDPVEATTEEIIIDFLILIGKEQEITQLQERGVIEEMALWIDTQVGTFMSLLGRFNTIVEQAWNAFSLDNISDIPAVFSGIFRDFTELLADFAVFAGTVALKVLELVKNAVLGWLATFANDIPGFHLMSVILGLNPFTGEPVERNVENIIRGFMGLLPGGEEQYQQMVETGAVPRAASQIEALMAELGISWDMVVGIFTGIWDELTIENFIEPLATFQRITDAFAEPITRLFTFVAKVVKIVIILILEIMNFPFELIGSIISNAMSAFGNIKRDPIGFLKNLLGAVKQGFQQFFDNILTHLMTGVSDWLFGQLGDAGITPPKDLSFQSILDLTFQILGITKDKIFEKLKEKVGPENWERLERTMETLSGAWAFVNDVMERGPVAIWEKIQEKLSDLWNMVLDAARNWIVTRIITNVTTKLLSMLDPSGIMAVVNSFIAFFKAVQSAIEYAIPILEMVNQFTTTVAEIARGKLKSAADFLENTMSRGMPILIGFLANQVGLGGIGRKIREVIESIQTKVDEGIQWMVDKAWEAGKAMLNGLGFGGQSEETEDERTPEQKEEALNLALTEANEWLDEENTAPEEVEGKLPALKAKYHLTSIDLRQNQNNQKFYVHIAINPEGSTDEEELDGDLPRRIKEAISQLGRSFIIVKEAEVGIEKVREALKNPDAFSDELTVDETNHPVKEIKAGQEGVIAQYLLGKSVEDYLTQGGGGPGENQKSDSELEEDIERALVELNRQGVLVEGAYFDTDQLRKALINPEAFLSQISWKSRGANQVILDGKEVVLALCILDRGVAGYLTTDREDDTESIPHFDSETDARAHIAKVNGAITSDGGSETFAEWSTRYVNTSRGGRIALNKRLDDGRYFWKPAGSSRSTHRGSQGRNAQARRAADRARHKNNND